MLVTYIIYNYIQYIVYAHICRSRSALIVDLHMRKLVPAVPLITLRSKHAITCNNIVQTQATSSSSRPKLSSLPLTNLSLSWPVHCDDSSTLMIQYPRKCTNERDERLPPNDLNTSQHLSSLAVQSAGRANASISRTCHDGTWHLELRSSS